MRKVNINISTHSGKEYEVIIKDFDPIKINDDLNNGEINTIVFGDVILSRIDVKSVSPNK